MSNRCFLATGGLYVAVERFIASSVCRETLIARDILSKHMYKKIIKDMHHKMHKKCKIKNLHLKCTSILL